MFLINAYIIFAAYILDLIFGDPVRFHPVRLIGLLITKTEKFLRRTEINEYAAGVMLAVWTTGLAYAGSFCLIKCCSRLHPYLGTAVSLYLIYTCIAVKDLTDHAERILDRLNAGDLAGARGKLSMIVARDTQHLDREGVARAAVESVAESIVDGIVSPLFYAFLGGAPLALAYKSVNTLDSMVGYKNSKYLKFGRAGAKLDDLANFVPARLVMFILPVASFLSGNGMLRTAAVMCRDRKKHPSPNSGIAEAAVAGALGVQLGGLSYYDSVAVEKPVIGINTRRICDKDILSALNISRISAALAVFLIVAVGIISAVAAEPDYKRIISLAPSITESIYSLDAGDRLAAVTSYCAAPDKAEEKPSIGPMNNPDIEKIFSLKPDIVLAAKGLTNIRIIKRIEDLGIKVIVFETSVSFEHIKENFRELADILDKGPEAEKIIRDISQAVKIISEENKTRVPQKIFWQVGANPLVTVGGESFVNELISLCNGKNIFSDITALYPRVSREEVVARNPDRIIIVTMGVDTETEKAYWKKFSRMSAIKNGRLDVINASVVSLPTPNGFIGALRELNKLLSLTSDPSLCGREDSGAQR